MLRNQSEIFLLSLITIFTLPYAFWRILKTDNFAPLVVVQIVSGVLLGPGVLGNISPTIYDSIFTADVTKMLSGISILSVISFVFTAGVEVDATKAWKHKKETSITAALALACPLALGALFASFIYTGNSWHGENSHRWQFILGVGMACAVTALPILVLLLEKLSLLRTDLGARCLRYASLDDIAIWGVLALILLDWGRIFRQIIFLVIFGLCFALIKKIKNKIKQHDRVYLSIIWLVVCALGADWCGLHYMVGGFLAGFAIDAEWLGDENLQWIRKILLYFMMPIFFLSTGLRTNWEIGGWTVLAVAGILFLLQVSGKLAGVRLAGLILGWPKTDSKIFGWLLQTKALIEIIFCTVLLDKGVISDSMFTALLIMAVISTSLTTPVVRRIISTNNRKAI